MRIQLLLICCCITALQSVSAATWESGTRECSLEFPDGWTFQEGGETNGGQILLNAGNLEWNKNISVTRLKVPAGYSIQDPRFVKGLEQGFTNRAGIRLLGGNYTNVNGQIAYRYTVEAVKGDMKEIMLGYTFCQDGVLYQISAICPGKSVLDDNELLAILSSFKLHARSGQRSKLVDSKYPLACRLGAIMGMLLIPVLVVGAVVILLWKWVKGRRMKTQVSENNEPERLRYIEEKIISRKRALLLLAGFSFAIVAPIVGWYLGCWWARLHNMTGDALWDAALAGVFISAFIGFFLGGVVNGFLQPETEKVNLVSFLYSPAALAVLVCIVGVIIHRFWISAMFLIFAVVTWTGCRVAFAIRRCVNKERECQTNK